MKAIVVGRPFAKAAAWIKAIGREVLIPFNLAVLGMSAMFTGPIAILACGASARSAEKTLGTCTEDAAAKALEPTVQSILVNASDANWKAILVAIGGAIGPSELNCIISFVEAEMKTVVGGPSPELAAAIARADEWLKSNPVAK